MNCLYDTQCGNPLFSRGLCKTHYHRSYTDGTLDSIALPKPDVSKHHKLSEIEADTKQGVCAICGPVTIYRKHRKNGSISWKCGKHAYNTRSHSGRYRFGDNQSIPVEDVKQAIADLLIGQQGVCAICGEAQTNNRALALDHCHVSGKIRGLLCLSCNTGLGHFKDNVDTLKAAIDYLNQ